MTELIRDDFRALSTFNPRNQKIVSVVDKIRNFLKREDKESVEFGSQFAFKIAMEEFTKVLEDDALRSSAENEELFTGVSYVAPGSESWVSEGALEAYRNMIDSYDSVAVEDQQFKIGKDLDW